MSPYSQIFNRKTFLLRMRWLKVHSHVRSKVDHTCSRMAGMDLSLNLALCEYRTCSKNLIHRIYILAPFTAIHRTKFHPSNKLGTTKTLETLAPDYSSGLPFLQIMIRFFSYINCFRIRAIGCLGSC